jgi:hypothetical protein
MACAIWSGPRRGLEIRRVLLSRWRGEGMTCVISWEDTCVVGGDKAGVEAVG